MASRHPRNAPSMRPRVASPHPMPPRESRMMRAKSAAPMAAPPSAPSTPLHPLNAPKATPMAAPGQDEGVGHQASFEVDDPDRQREDRHDGKLERRDAPPEPPADASQQKAGDDFDPQVARADGRMTVAAFAAQEDIAPDGNKVQGAQLMPARGADGPALDPLLVARNAPGQYSDEAAHECANDEARQQI